MGDTQDMENNNQMLKSISNTRRIPTVTSHQWKGNRFLDFKELLLTPETKRLSPISGGAFSLGSFYKKARRTASDTDCYLPISIFDDRPPR